MMKNDKKNFISISRDYPFMSNMPESLKKLTKNRKIRKFINRHRIWKTFGLYQGYEWGEDRGDKIFINKISDHKNQFWKSQQWSHSPFLPCYALLSINQILTSKKMLKYKKTNETRKKLFKKFIIKVKI